jgi:putative DNA primase/helicase
MKLAERGEICADAIRSSVVVAREGVGEFAPQRPLALGGLMLGRLGLTDGAPGACRLLAVLFLLHGGGSNGKTTWINAIETMCGEYGLTLPASSLLERRTGDGPSNDLAQSPGTRFVSAAETGAGGRFNEERVKALTGGDTMSARFLYGEFFTFTPTLKLWLSTNHLPVISGTDEAIWRRIHLIPFHVTIPAPERDATLTERLRREADGILAWAVTGCREWSRDGLRPPSAVLAATSRYRDDMDVLGEFIAECCEALPDASVSAGALYGAYAKWCERNGERAMTKHALGRRLSERGFENRRTSSARLWTGLKLKAQP